MNYNDNSKVVIGDRISHCGRMATIVAIIDEDGRWRSKRGYESYENPDEEKALFVLFDYGVLVNLVDVDEDVEFVSRESEDG